jgi:glycine/D-amino acid oxidase-like deaminating enzyme
MGLISTGGPEKILKAGEMYSRDNSCEDWAEKDIDNFLKKNYRKHKGEKVEYDFCWHGLLGYTNSGIRMIGAEPKNKNLIYNLGCNGIGIMPSIYGAKKVSQIINNENMEASIFDIKQ